MNDPVKRIVDSLALDDKEEADSAFKDLMRNKVKEVIDTKTVEVANKVYNVTESLEEESISEDALYEEAIDAILEDADITISEMSDEDVERILGEKFTELSEIPSLLKKIGKGIADRITVSGRAERAAKKAAKGDKKIADREKLMKAKLAIKAQKELRKAQKAAKAAGKPIPRGYKDAGITPPEIAFKQATKSDSTDAAEKAKKEKEAAEKAKKEKEAAEKAAAEKAAAEKEKAAATAAAEKKAEEEKEKAKKDAGTTA